MKSAVMFSKASDQWETPQNFYDVLDAEFGFELDVAANARNNKCGMYYDATADALSTGWAHEVSPGPVCWMNPPYSKCSQFIAKAAEEARKGATVVALVPSRTDTRWWHEHVWSDVTNKPRSGVEVRFVRGRLKFGDGKNSAPFPSVVIVFRGR